MLRLVLCLFLLLPQLASSQEFDHSSIIASLVDPAKIDTLKSARAANPRLRKISYYLEDALRTNKDLTEVISEAQIIAGYSGTPRAKADLESLLRNRVILERLGCLTPEGMENLKRGRAPVITKGPYSGDIASVDHIIPRSIVLELDLRLYNLEFMPSKLNLSKSNKIGLRQRQLAEKWHVIGLISDAGLAAVRTKFPSEKL